MKNFTQKFIGLLALLFTMSFSINAQEIGDFYQGGYIFQINEDGTGLVVSNEETEVMTFSNAQNAAANATTEGYEDWYLPNIDQLESLYNTIGPGGDISLGLVFQAGEYPSQWMFWSSSITPSNSNYVYILNFVDGEINENYYPQNWTYSSRAIREVILGYGCTDETASNFDASANINDDSCVSWEDLANTLLGQLENIVPEDGIGQDDVDAAYADGAASVTPEDGVGQADVDAAYTEGVASVEIPEFEEVATQNMPLDLPEGWSMFGYTCMDSVDAMVGFSAISDKIEIVKDEWGLSYLPSWDFNAMGSLQFSEGYQIKMIEVVTNFQFCDAIIPEDGVSQADVDTANAAAAAAQLLLADANQIISELQIEDNWSYPTEYHFWYWQEVQDCLNGDAYACTQAANTLFAFNTLSQDIPYEISGCVNVLEMGYDQWHATSYECPDALNSPELLADFFGSTYELDECGVVGGNNSSCTDGCGVVNGDNSSCADECGVPNGDNSTCTDECGVLNGDNSSCADECGVPNGDNSTCLDCAGVPNGTSEDLGCGCDIPGAQDGYDCNGNLLQIGDITAGGIIFEINEDGTGLVAAFQDLYRVVGNVSYPHMDWAMAMSFAGDYTSQGYDDWRLPSIEELELMYYTIGQGADNLEGFEDWNYWSSTFEGSCMFCPSEDASSFHFGEGNYVSWWVDNPGVARAIRSF